MRLTYSYKDTFFSIIRPNLSFKACVRYFLSNFYFSSNDSPSKTTKNVFLLDRRQPGPIKSLLLVVIGWFSQFSQKRL